MKPASRGMGSVCQFQNLENGIPQSPMSPICPMCFPSNPCPLGPPPGTQQLVRGWRRDDVMDDPRVCPWDPGKQSRRPETLWRVSLCRPFYPSQLRIRGGGGKAYYSPFPFLLGVFLVHFLEGFQRHRCIRQSISTS